MAFTAVYDANVLHPAALRDFLIRLGQTGLLRARWTEQILDEMTASILRRRPDLDASKLARTRTLMCEAVADCLVTGYEPLIKALVLPDSNDRHVLAAAIRCSAGVIVTSNLSDFPPDAVAPFNITIQSPTSSPSTSSTSPRSCRFGNPTTSNRLARPRLHRR